MSPANRDQAAGRLANAAADGPFERASWNSPRTSEAAQHDTTLEVSTGPNLILTVPASLVHGVHVIDVVTRISVERR